MSCIVQIMAGSVVNSPQNAEKVVVAEEHIKNKQEKKARKRRKGVYRRLVKQMEFYFSDANLRHSTFLLSLYEADPWVTLTTFLTFNKVATMLSEILGDKAEQEERVAELTKAISVIGSDTIHLSECKLKVGRKSPFTPSLPTQVDSCTVYVENLPSEADHDYIRNIFSSFGIVQYVSLPKFKSGRSKGFAFVEFDSADVVEKVLSELSHVDSKPDDLASVRSFNEENTVNKDSKSRKRKVDGSDMEVGKAKKVKTETEDGDELCDVRIEQSNGMILDGENVKKEVSDIRVLSKIQWKKLRNNYLNEQRKNFAALKHILKKPMTPSSRERADDSKDSNSEDVKVEGKTSEAVKEEIKVEIKPGCIVRLQVPGGVDNIQKLKQKVREGLNGEAVAYVDGKVGAEEVFVRCVDTSQAARLGVLELGDGWKGEVIAGKEEEEYHAKIERDKKDKRSGKVVVKKTKTKTKLIQKAASLKNNHVYFD